MSGKLSIQRYKDHIFALLSHQINQLLVGCSNAEERNRLWHLCVPGKVISWADTLANLINFNFFNIQYAKHLVEKELLFTQVM